MLSGKVNSGNSRPSRCRGRSIREMEVSRLVGAGKSAKLRCRDKSGRGEFGVKGAMFVVINACYVGKLKSELSLMHVTLENLDQSCRACTLRWKIEAGVVTKGVLQGKQRVCR